MIVLLINLDYNNKKVVNLLIDLKLKINNLKNEYNTTLNKMNRLGGGFEVGRIIATQMVHARNRQENYNNLLN